MSKVGRPAKTEEDKMEHPFRCLGTKAMKEYWQEKAAALGKTESELLRIAIYSLIRPWNGAPKDDPMFKDIEK